MPPEMSANSRRKRNDERRGPHRRVTTRRRLIPLLLAGLLIIGVLSPLSGTAQAARNQREGGLRVLGVLPDSVGSDSGNVVGIDRRRRLMYYMHRRGPLFYLREYDLSTQVPKLIEEQEMGNYAELGINYYSPYTIALDESRRLLIVLVTHTHGTALKFIDLRTLDFIGEWDLGSVRPGFVGQGMTLSEEDGKIYVIGSEAGNAYGTFSFGFQKPAQPAMVMAVDARISPDQDPSIEWVKVIPECQQIMDTTTIGALVARSKKLPALYFACVRPNPYPGESGVIRLTIDPTADQQAAVDFPVEFFPVSGSFSSPTAGIIGISAFDPKRERFFVQSLSEATPGVWVLDGLKSNWVGFIASPDNSNRYLGLDPVSGHYYMGGARGKGFIVVSDTSGIPIDQGRVMRGFTTWGFIAVDPSTQRLFVPVDVKRLGLSRGKEENVRGLVVIRDESSISEPTRPLDYDALTSDAPEGPRTVTSFSSGVNGYGARVLLIGGYSGLLSASGQSISVGNLRPGDRGIAAARVPTLDVRDAGATASAQELLSDSNTEAELKENTGAEWPWAPASCLDGAGGKPESNTQTSAQGEATVRCDLSKERAEVTVSFGTVAAPAVAIGSSYFSAIAYRDGKLGSVTEVTSSANGIELSAPDGTSASIGRVAATATTAAHGHAGTTRASWERVISGVEIRDAEGEVTDRLGGCSSSDEEDTCKELAEALSEALQIRMRINLPEPEVIKTPKGAFAGVQQTDADFHAARTVYNQGTAFAEEAASRAVPGLEIVVFNDSVEKSRLLIQLAALQTNSIYTISPREPSAPSTPIDTTNVDVPDSPTTDGVGNLNADLTDVQVPGFDGANEVSPIEAPEPEALAAAPASLEGRLAFLAQPARDAVLLVCVWLLCIAAAAGVARRRALLGVIGGGDR
jgi:hypothetical protein